MTVQEAMTVEKIEKSLLSYAPMCYEVAFRLTQDRRSARRMAERVILWAFANPEKAMADGGLKMGLLSRIRADFREQCRQIVLPFRSHAGRAYDFDSLRLAS